MLIDLQEYLSKPHPSRIHNGKIIGKQCFFMPYRDMHLVNHLLYDWIANPLYRSQQFGLNRIIPLFFSRLDRVKISNTRRICNIVYI